MAGRVCSCCDQIYTDNLSHDYETCVKNCQERLEKARREYIDASERLELAQSRRQAQRKGLIK